MEYILSQFDIRRFWSKVNKTSTCWLWTDAPTKNFGYGQFKWYVDGEVKVASSHRLVWTIVKGPIPEGKFVCHDCPGGDNPACVNPGHLFLGTQRDNMQDRDNKKRQACGEANGNSKLSTALVLAIREDYANYPKSFKAYSSRLRAKARQQRTSVVITKLALEYRQTTDTIKRVVLRYSWKHVA